MPIIMTIDCECDMIENNLAMIQMLKEEKIKKENEVVVYGRSLPTEVWEKIKEYNDWTDKCREIRNMMIRFPNNNNGRRAGRIAPTVRIGDEICDGDTICGRVVKIQKASVDIETYAFIGYKRTIIVENKQVPSGVNIHGFNYSGSSFSRVIYKATYKWKKNVVKKIRWIGSYKLGDNGGGFHDESSFSSSIGKYEEKKYSNKNWVMGIDFKIEPHPKDGRRYIDMDNC